MHAATLEALQGFVRDGELRAATLECQIRAPDCAVAREPVWVFVEASEGAHTHAWIESTRGRLSLPVDVDGTAMFTPEHCGVYCIVAQAVEGPGSPAESRSVPVEARIEVVAPPVVMDAWPREVTGPAGSLQRLQWAVRGAERIELRLPARGEVMPLPLRGAVEIEIDVVPETFILVAVALDGREEQTTLMAMPVTKRDDETVRALMKQVTQPWRRSP